MIVDLLAEHVGNGLQRRTITTCSRWAESYRVLKGKRWTHERYPWLRAIQDADSRLVIGQKAAQVGYTEAALNKTFFKIDIEHTDCLYVLPSESDASDFSSSRFNPALGESKHLQSIFSDVDNIGLKRAGDSTLFVRGGRSRSRLKSIPTGFIVLDEINEMPESNIPLVLERMSGQDVKQCMMISTPTVHNEGINKFYNNSTMEHFFFKCPSCSKLIELLFPDNVKVTAEQVTDSTLKDSYYFCDQCGVTLPHETKTEWLSTSRFVAQHPERDNRGFTIPQMYSPTIQPWELCESYLKSLYDPTEEQEFFNSKLGVTHVVGDSRVLNEHIDACKKDYTTHSVFASSIRTMGVDVGAKWHYEIDEWDMVSEPSETLDYNDVFNCRLMREGEFDLHDGVERIAELILKYNIMGVVIDRHPETYAVYQIAARFPGLVYACMFGRGMTGRRITMNDDEQMMTVDRTSWFDCAIGRVISGRMGYPQNLSLEYQKHLKVPVRVYGRDKSGNPVGRWESPERNDHFALTRVYSEIGLGIALENSQPTSIEKVF